MDGRFQIGRIIGLLGFFFAIAMAEETEQLPDLVVEAVRDSVLPPDFAGSATVIHRSEIEQSGSRSVADLLVARGGVRITSSTGNLSGGEIHLRGFGENSASRVLVLVNGRPLNRADMAASSLLEIPISQLDRVEILRGAQTAKFGDNAVGGVINLVTKRAGAEAAGYLESAGGSDDAFLSRAGYSKRIDGNGLSLNLERNDTAGWRDHSASELDSASIRWDKDLTPSANLTAGFAWTDEYTEFPGPLGEEAYRNDPRQSIYEQSGYGDQYFSEETTRRFDGTLKLGGFGGADFEVPLAWTHRDLSWNFGPGSHTDNLMNTVTLVPQVSHRNGNWESAAGLSMRYDSLDLDQFAEISRQNRIGSAKLDRAIIGVFSSVDWKWADDWHLSTGARWEHSKVDAKAVNDRYPDDPELNFSQQSQEQNAAFQIGLRWDAREDVSAWLRYDRFYRLPSTDEIASYQGYPLSVPFNANLTAEKGHNLELGVEYSPGEWTWRLNGFAQWMQGEIAYDYLQNLNVNLADTRRYGIEASTGYHGRIWDADLRYTWLQAEYTDGEYAGKDVYLVPHHELSGTLSWQLHEKLRFQSEYQWVGSAYEGNDFSNTQEKLPGYQLVNALLNFTPRPGLSIYARINNVFDEHYATIKYSGQWYPGAGRQFLIGLRKDF
ncbi:TonB-dependent receptor [Luteolibacter pohnpeiensis]|uniref:TonB-dependent receptor n=2 Tax=Luteolibacter pohnpeiensis TaxID=454153 RepID=A0A934VV64_9BACT|nr:TonB-dependent receptor [Luteolibacter pohnpeiensis]